jgi:hypothetical protein
MSVLTLVVWALAAMHCKLETLPGFDFLRSCCFADAASASPEDCDTDGCGAVEDGGYRAEEQTVSAPQPLLVAAVLACAFDAPMAELPMFGSLGSVSPPELPGSWQFAQRAALLPRAPSAVS